ncbi:HD-GYP domain-containing protein [Flocculibacter collagenilyticus]|uniref:HD-GYP domain-containing protein n=1 Tax=Flocculibacter collagenilyticus TaxID=2744479 RepID=UPI0018F5B5E9|nr:HD-GYP domain-containing protein [Flocculibacter collagenilyticus]
MENISIDELKPGMFVQGVLKQTGKAKVKSSGWVKTQQAIDKLRQVGITEITIDPDKTITDKPKKPEPEPEPKEPEKPVPPHPTIPRVALEQELGNANKLFEQAVELQKKTLDDVKSGKPLNVAPLESLTKGVIESVFNNQDALACLTRLHDKEGYLFDHAINSSILMSIFAKHMQFDEDIIEQLAMGALLHDLGEVKLPNKLLSKKGKLTAEEYDTVKQHIHEGWTLLKQTNGISDIVLDVALNHHERLDGSGYQAKAGDDISQYARMMAIIDSYEAMTSERSYRKDSNPIQAFKKLRRDCPNCYDESLLGAFISCIGLHPVGTLVKLKSGKLALVTKSNFDDPLRPTVKVFFNAKYEHYTAVNDLDLASKKVDDEIESSIKPEEFKIDLLKFFKHAVIAE